MIRVVTVVASALLLAAPAAAQDGGMPTELWSEYPLVQTVERTSQPGLGPFLPPTDAVVAPGSEDTPPWGLLALAAAAGVMALLVATRLTRPAPASRGGDQGSAPVQLRPPPAQPRVSSTSLPLAQYAPSPSLLLVDAPEEPLRSVVRRTGLVRSRFVVLERTSPGAQDAVASSRSFWSVGGASLRERRAEDAWDELMNELRASGWEPDPTRRSDFYVLLQPIETDVATIVPTIEAYGRAGDSED
jgi:hypothetical protein